MSRSKEYESLSISEKLTYWANEIMDYDSCTDFTIDEAAQEMRRIAKELGPQEKIPVGTKVLVTIDNYSHRFDYRNIIVGHVLSYHQCDSRTVEVCDDCGNTYNVDLSWCEILK